MNICLGKLCDLKKHLQTLGVEHVMMFSPDIKPSRPVLHYHERFLGLHNRTRVLSRLYLAPYCHRRNKTLPSIYNKNPQSISQLT